MARRIRKAVFPVAGLGTRFLPATKSVPKEMLTVVDRPVLQHGPVDDRQHLLRHGFRRRQKAGAESGDRENCLADASRHGNLELSSDRVRGLRYEGSFGVEVNATPVEHSSARSVRAATPR